MRDEVRQILDAYSTKMEEAEKSQIIVDALAIEILKIRDSIQSEILESELDEIIEITEAVTPLDKRLTKKRKAFRRLPYWRQFVKPPNNYWWWHLDSTTAYRIRNKLTNSILKSETFEPVTQLILAITQFALVVVGIWYTVETQKLRIQNDSLLANSFTQTAITSQQTAISAHQSRRGIKPVVTAQVFTPKTALDKGIIDEEESSIYYLVSLENVSSNIALEVDIIIYDNANKNYVAAGNTSLKGGDNYNLRVEYSPMNEQEALEYVEGYHGNNNFNVNNISFEEIVRSNLTVSNLANFDIADVRQYLQSSVDAHQKALKSLLNYSDKNGLTDSFYVIIYQDQENFVYAQKRYFGVENDIVSYGAGTEIFVGPKYQPNDSGAE